MEKRSSGSHYLLRKPENSLNGLSTDKQQFVSPAMPLFLDRSIPRPSHLHPTRNVSGGGSISIEDLASVHKLRSEKRERGLSAPKVGDVFSLLTTHVEQARANMYFSRAMTDFLRCRRSWRRSSSAATVRWRPLRMCHGKISQHYGRNG